MDDHLKLKDNTNEVDIYHVIANNHMADAVLAHVPASSLLDDIDHRKIKVVTNLAVHAQQPVPIAEEVWVNPEPPGPPEPAEPF